MGLGPNNFVLCSQTSGHETQGPNVWLLLLTDVGPPNAPGNDGLCSRGGPKYLALCCYWLPEKENKENHYCIS